MGGIAIKIEGRDLTYFPAGEEITQPADDVVGLDFLEDRELLIHSRIRRVLTTLVRSSPKFYGALHWSDGNDLVVLDSRVRSGAVADQDFAGALLAEARTVVCTACGAQIRCLAVDTGQVLFARSLPERLRSHRLEKTCPVCAAMLTVPIVEFLMG
jgi:hypothetical protein